MQLIEGYTQLIEKAIAKQQFQGQPRNLYEPISYILSLGGKRLRPALTLAACELYGSKATEALDAALAIEIFHNFSLVHDDIMDKADLRRGQATVHKKWNQDIAILSGDAMLVKAYQYLAKVDTQVLPAVLEVFSQTAIEVCEGQQLDVNFETQDQVLEADYIEMIRLKTSVLLGCALKIGALVAGASSVEAENLYHFGEKIGIAFQIQDDILDAFGEPEKFGKTPGGDILNNKKTIMMIHALNHANDDQQLHLLASNIQAAEKIKTVQELFVSLGSKAHAMRVMDRFYQEALVHLEKSNGKDALKKELATFAEWLIKRDL